MSPDTQRLLHAISAVMLALRVDASAQTRTAPYLRYNPADFQALRLIAQNNTTPSDLARALSLPRATITSLTDRLERKGLIKRMRPQTDRRMIILMLTPIGKKAVAAIAQEDDENCARMLAAIAPERRDAFLEDMDNIAQAMAHKL